MILKGLPLINRQFLLILNQHLNQKLRKENFSDSDISFPSRTGRKKTKQKSGS
jgi:hypothetical protein